jgi:hypothetical protein
VAGHGHVIEVVRGYSGGLQAKPDGPAREPSLILLPSEALLFHRGHHDAINEQRGRGVRVVGVDPQNCRQASSLPVLANDDLCHHTLPL